MKIFLDTANLKSIKKFNDMGLLDGITTNPSLMSKEGGNPKNAMEEITKNVVQETVRRNENIPPTEAIKITTMAGCSAVKK